MMEMSCESVRYGKNSRRPKSRKTVELHVLCVPEEQWNIKLNKVPAKATESFISVGFIRVYPDTTLKTLRGELDTLLGTDRRINKYSFLKCIGRSLAVVKSKQERELKVKTFAPPYAEQPELYLLPSIEMDSSFWSQSFTPDTSNTSPDQHIYYQQPQMCKLPMGTKEPVKFPHIPQCSQQAPPTSGLEKGEDEDEENEEDNHSCTSSERENDEDAPNPIRRAEQDECKREPQSQSEMQLNSLKKALEADLPTLRVYRQGTFRKNHQHPRDPDSVAAESHEDRDSCFSLTNEIMKSEEVHMPGPIRTKAVTGVRGSQTLLSDSICCPSVSSDLNLAGVTSKTFSTPPTLHTNREAVIKQIKRVKEQRKQLEWTRQELLRKGKDLLAQNRHRRNLARDSWKKKYFETKKATVPLEENLKILRQELDAFYNKLLQQLQARESKKKTRQQGRTSAKNELIIQIMTENYEIENLKRTLEDAKMKLITEIKLTTQAATELRTLKAELAQKKSEFSHPA